MDYWNRDYERDIEKEYHNQNLYILWNEKTTFMKKAMDYNYFNTDFYCWADIGMIRDKRTLEYIKTFPSSNMLNVYDKSKIYLLYLEAFTNLEIKYINDACDAFKYKDNVGATFMIAHKSMLNTWVDVYYSMLNRFMEKDLFAGNDQSIINCICLIFPQIVKLIKPINIPIDIPIDRRFYMLFLFY